MAARAIWKGVIKIAGSEVPVNLFSAVQDRTVHFRLLHREDLQPVKQQLVAATTDEEVENTETQKAYPIGRDRFVVLTDEDIDSVAPKESRDIEITRFVDRLDMDPRWYERAYWLAPGGSSAAYFALAEALEKKQKEGIARWVMRKKDYIGSLRADRGYLMLIVLRHADEIISADALNAPSGRALDEREVTMGEQLLSMLAGKFDIEDYKDEYRARVMELVEAKSKGRKPKVALFKPKKTNEDALASALEASLAGITGKKKVSGGRR